MTKETYLAIIAIYTIDKIREAHKIAGGELYSHAAAIKHHEAEERQALLEGKDSNAYVGRKLNLGVRQVQKLRQEIRDKKKKQ